jgi:ParB family chromosome partitioning protein
MEHELKTWPDMFQATYDGIKTAEFRKNDRDFKDGDILELREFDPVLNSYSGRVLTARVMNIVYGGSFGIPDGYCMMSILTPTV